MLFGLTLVIAVFLVTALFGRAWCGWGCPQTVYLEWVFRPIERWIEGPRGGSKPRRALTFAVFAALSVVVGNVFLAYFVGVDQLAAWVRSSPFEHPTGFLIMAGVSALVFFDFAWFREQTCILACPYGRLQTVLLDRQSTIVGYDATRGEPRGKVGKRLPVFRTSGDCVDCRACVATCPTGIDIRNGLQMECIGCAQCVDACDAIMERLGRPHGLIRHASQDTLAGKPRRVLRTRTIVYPALLAIAGGLLAWQLRAHPAADVWAVRVDGAPFVVLADGRVSSQAPIRIENRSDATRHYTIELVDAPDLELATPRAPIAIAAGRSAVVPVVVLAPARGYAGGERPVLLQVRDEAGFAKTLHHTLLGPDAAETR
jgi:cytochrome c oxidase accessory protein FixG